MCGEEKGTGSVACGRFSWARPRSGRSRFSHMSLARIQPVTILNARVAGKPSLAGGPEGKGEHSFWWASSCFCHEYNTLLLQRNKRKIKLRK